MLAVFTIAHNTETKDTQLVGNIQPLVAMSLLQEAIIVDSVKKGMAEKEAKEKEQPKLPLPLPS